MEFLIYYVGLKERWVIDVSCLLAGQMTQLRMLGMISSLY